MGTIYEILPILLYMAFPNVVRSIPGKSGQLHSSPEHLEMVFSFDKLVGEGLKYLVPPSDRVQRYLESYRWLATDAASLNIDTVHPAFIGNPLHVYAVIKRLVLYWPPAKEIMYTFLKLTAGNETCRDKYDGCSAWVTKGKCLTEQNFMYFNCTRSCGLCQLIEHAEKIKVAEERSVLPSMEDLEGAAEGIGHLQQVYKIPIPHLVSGRILNNFTSVELNEWDCLRIARAAIWKERYAPSWFWYNHVRNIVKDTEMEDYIDDLLKIVIKGHDDTWKSDGNYFRFPLSQVPVQSTRTSPVFELCRGNEFRVMDNLTCTLTTKGVPYLFLQPLKEETILSDPEMNLYYDILSDIEIKTLMLLSRDKLEKDPLMMRKSLHAFLWKAEHPVLDSINRRASYITGLHTYESLDGDGSAEPLKIRNYGTGGYLDPHVDVFYKHQGNDVLPEEKHRIPGDRMATVMFYLNNVEAGGRTVFYYEGAAIAPVRGAALVWNNLLKNGTYDRRVDHAGCPVVLGNKWLGIKWIKENDNFLRRPCSMNPDE